MFEHENGQMFGFKLNTRSHFHPREVVSRGSETQLMWLMVLVGYSTPKGQLNFSDIAIYRYTLLEVKNRFIIFIAGVSLQ